MRDYIVFIAIAAVLACAPAFESHAIEPKSAKQTPTFSAAVELASYTTWTLDKHYWLDMKLSGEELMPLVLPAMPMHHASRLEFENAEAFAHTLRAEQLYRITFRAMTSEIVQMPGRNAWRATYRAQILDVALRGQPETGTPQ
jgi:hypothetical protein